MSDKMMPRVRFKGFTEAWEQRKLKSMVDVNSGRDYKHLSHGKVPVYGTGGYMLSVNKALSENKDAIGIGRKGTIDRPYLLRAPFWTVDTLFYVIPKFDFNLEFTYVIFQNIDWKQKDESTGVPSLSKNTINSAKVMAPNLTEQLIIGSTFSKLDSTIASNQKKVERLKTVKKLLMQKIFDQEWRFKGFTEPWEQRKLSDLTNYFNGKAHENNLNANGKYELITLKSVSSDGIIQPSGKYVNETDNFLKKGTLVMVLSEQNKGAVGLTARIPLDNHYILNQRVAELRPNKIVNSEFLSKSINKNQQYFEIRSAGTKVQNISRGNVENYQTFVPSIEEQDKIALVSKNIDNLIASNQKKVEQLKTLKKWLMQNLFV